MSKTEPCGECHLDGLNTCDICGWERPSVTSRPSVESLWQAFWATPHDEREWNRPTGTNGKPMPMTLISFKYEVVRAALELDRKRNECCDTPAYCSSVRRCTAKDSATPPPGSGRGVANENG